MLLPQSHRQAHRRALLTTASFLGAWDWTTNRPNRCTEGEKAEANALALRPAEKPVKLVGAGDGTRTRKSCRMAVLKTAAFASFATPASSLESHLGPLPALPGHQEAARSFPIWPIASVSRALTRRAVTLLVIQASTLVWKTSHTIYAAISTGLFCSYIRSFCR